NSIHFDHRELVRAVVVLEHRLLQSRQSRPTWQRRMAAHSAEQMLQVAVETHEQKAKEHQRDDLPRGSSPPWRSRAKDRRDQRRRGRWQRRRWRWRIVHTFGTLIHAAAGGKWLQKGAAVLSVSRISVPKVWTI